MSEHADVVVIGGGQAGLAAGYYLRREGLNFVILDRQDRAGGAWRQGWDSLRLFSPAECSPLPGWPMPRQRGERFPTAGHVVEYLHDYEQRYELPVHRPVPERVRGQRVLVDGAGNSAAQIVAEVSTIAETTWATRHPPRFMPDDVDGRVLFDTATREEAARKAGTHADGVSGLGDIVMVPSVRAARDRGVLRPRPLFDRLTAEGAAWSDGTMDPYDVIIWCTGFRPTLNHLASLGLRRENGVPKTIGTRSADEPRLYLLGYGDWTGFASATLIGAGRTAKDAVHDITSHLPAVSLPQ